MAGNLKPDQPLMEREIASELNVSRTPVREALFILQGEGLVELVPRRYARVRKITYTDISQIYSLRKVLEVYSAENAARFSTPAAILDIETALIRQKNLDRNCSAIEQAHADLAFHAAIAAASGSMILTTVINQVLAFTSTLRSRMKYEATQSKLALKQHREILQSIKDKDPANAAARMADHISTSTAYAKSHSGVADE